MDDRGPISTYQVIWKSGHVEEIQAHQVMWPDHASSLFGGAPAKNPRVMFHGEINGQWQLVLAAPEDDITSVRLMTSVPEEA